MSYSSFPNHLLNLSRYTLIFVIFFMLLPRIFSRKGKGSFLEQFFRNYIKAVFFFIVLGYLLIIFKIYELLTLFFSILLIFTYFYRKNNNIATWNELIHLSMIWVYDFADGLIYPRKLFYDWFKKKIYELKFSLNQYFGNWCALGYTLLFSIIFIYTAYLRFYNAFKHAAPSMSDSYVVIAWIKYVDRKMLFHDGIYPQGFHIYLDFIHKFSALDPLYVVNFSGAFHSVLIVLGIYFSVSRWTGQKGAGLLTAALYGILGSYLPLEWIRQAACNSQEFAFVFLMPAFYFFSQYVKEGNRDDFITGTAAVFLVGLVHSLAFGFIGIGMGVLVLLMFLMGWRKYKQRILRMVLAGILGVVVSIIPIGIGMIMGKDFYGASAEYLFRQEIKIILPELYFLDYLALAILLLLLLFLIIKRKREKEPLMVGFIVILGIFMFFLYYYGGLITKNVVISTRSSDLWSIMIPVILGMGWYEISGLFIPLRPRIFELILGFSLVVYILFYIKPEPIIPYKMEYDTNVEQYLRISNMHKPTEWMAVSQEEGYALVYGKGYHLMLGDFLDLFDPYVKQLKDCPEDVFIFNEKKVFWPPLNSTIMDYSIYERREEENKQLEKWVELYAQNNNNISVFYEDDNIKIFRIHQERTKEDEFNLIWG